MFGLEDVVALAIRHPEWTLVLLGAASLIEYVFPPFPGDAVVLAGIVLVLTSDLSLPAAFVAILAGSLAGAALDFQAGVLLARWRRRAGGATGGGPSAATGPLRRLLDGCDRASRAFSRMGEVAIVANRFLPGIRAFLFVAAGMGGLRRGRVLLYAAVSSALWNALLVGVGIAVEANLDRLESFARALGVGGWATAGIGAVVAVAWKARRRAAGRATSRRDRSRRRGTSGAGSGRRSRATACASSGCPSASIPRTGSPSGR